jgi:hypothetical protein
MSDYQERKKEVMAACILTAKQAQAVLQRKLVWSQSLDLTLCESFKRGENGST